MINASTDTVSATIPVGLLPFGISVNPNGTRVYVANQNSNTLSVLDIVADTVSGTIPVGNTPFAFGNFISTYPVITTGLSAKSIESSSISIYPNPASSTVTIHLPIQSGQLSTLPSQLIIEDVLGNKIFQQSLTATDTDIDVSKWSAGVYFYHLIGENKEVIGVGKIMVE